MNGVLSTQSTSHRKRAVAIVTTAVLVPVLLGFAALTVDVSVMYNVRADLQNAADAGVLAAVEAMTNGDPNLDRLTRARIAAKDIVGRNHVLGKSLILSDSDIVFGRSSYDEGANRYTFTPSNFAPDAIQVTVQHTSNSPNGAAPLFFAAIFGKHFTDISASATAATSPRDMAIVVDLSGSTNFDSQLQHANITQVNIHQVWAALPGGYNEINSAWTDADIKPGWVKFDGSVPQAAGPAWGYFKELGFGEVFVNASYDPNADAGLVRLKKYGGWNDANLSSSLAARGYNNAEINAIFSSNYDRNGGYDERVAIALGFAEWQSGKSGGFGNKNGLNGGNADNRLEKSELIWTQSIMGRTVNQSRNIFREYINNYVASSYSYMTRSSSAYRYQYGAKTFTDFLLARRRTNSQTPELAQTPTEPLESMKQAVQYMSDLFTEIDSNDQLSLEAYATTAKHELDLSFDYASVADRLQALQAGHYNGSTNLGAGIERAIAELNSSRGRDTARKVLVLLTDGNANVSKSGAYTTSGGAAYALSAAEDAKDLGFQIFTITVGADANQELMRQIADMTGGDHFHAQGSMVQYRAQLLDIFREVGSRKQPQLIF